MFQGARKEALAPSGISGRRRGRQCWHVAGVGLRGREHQLGCGRPVSPPPHPRFFPTGAAVALEAPKGRRPLEEAGKKAAGKVSPSRAGRFGAGGREGWSRKLAGVCSFGVAPGKQREREGSKVPLVSFLCLLDFVVKRERAGGREGVSYRLGRARAWLDCALTRCEVDSFRRAHSKPEFLLLRALCAKTNRSR